MSETWFLIPEFPSYSASSLGRIRRETAYRSTKAGHIMTPRTINGYQTVTVKGMRRYVHRLVCSAFNGRPTDEAPQAAHLNGDRLDNRAENLRWVSQLENEADKSAHGTRKQGSSVANSKLTEDQVRTLREAFSTGIASKAELARTYNVHPSMVARIIARTAWSHVE